MPDVPNTTTFTLQDVVDSVLPSLDTLQTCFDEATGIFDPTHEGGKDRLSNFQNYKAQAAWNIASATFNNSRGFATQTTSGRQIFFNPSGLIAYLIDNSANLILKYNLPTAWDLSAGFNYSGTSKSIGADGTGPLGLFFKPDGKKLWTVDSQVDKINEYEMTVAYDIANATFARSKSVSAEDTSPRNAVFSADGLMLYLVGGQFDSIYQYSVSVAWNVSTASASPIKTLSISQDNNPFGMFFRDDGLKFYIAGDTVDVINQYDLSIAWDIDTAVFVGALDVTPQDSSVVGIAFKPDGLKAFVVGNSTDNVIEYDL